MTKKMLLIGLLLTLIITLNGCYSDDPKPNEKAAEVPISSFSESVEISDEPEPTKETVSEQTEVNTQEETEYSKVIAETDTTTVSVTKEAPKSNDTENNTLFSQWDVTMEDLHKNALDVTAQRNPYVLSNMDDELWGNPVNFLDGADYVNAGMLLVASNEQKHYGANIIADKNMLEKISQVINDDMYILPSSVHELLILPKENAKDLGMTPKALGEMVRDVNRTQVEPKERLANHVYEYNRDTKELAIVNSSREKAMER